MDTNKSLIKDQLFWFSMICSGFILSFTLWLDFGPDQAGFSYIALVWTKYRLPPYLGVFAADFPGIFIIHRAAQSLFGNTALGLRIFDLIGQTACAAMIYWLAVRISARRAAGFLATMFYVIYYLGLGRVQSTQRDSFAFWFLLGAICLALYRKRPGGTVKVIAGLLLGFAFLIKPTFGLAWPVMGLWFLFSEFREKPRRIWAELLAYSLACLLPALSVLLVYWRADHLQELYYSTLWYQFEIFAQIAPTSPAQRVRGMIWILYTYLVENPLTIPPAGFAVLLFARNWEGFKARKEFRLLILMISVSLASGLIQGKNVPYHHTPVLGLVFIFSGAGWAAIGDKLVRGSRVPDTIFVTLFYLFITMLALASLPRKDLKFFALYSYRGLERAYANAEPCFDLKDQRAAAKYLKPRLGPGDRIEFFGWHPLLPYLLESQPPSRFAHAYQLLLRNHDGKLRPKQAEWIREFSDTVIAARPRFFIISTYIPRSWPMLLKDYDLKNILRTQFPELNAFLVANYQLRETIDLIEIYELAPDAAKKPGPAP